LIVIKVSSANGIGKRLIDDLSTNRATTMSNLILYLNQVQMAGFDCQIGMSSNQIDPILHFTIKRDSQNEESRKSWDKLLDRLNYRSSKVQIQLAFSGGLPQSVVGDLSFSAVSDLRKRTIVLCALILFASAMGWAVRSGMLREGGPQTAHSLGRTQMAFWGLLVATSFLGIFAATWEMERLPAQTLILMGISGTTVLSAILVGSAKRSSASNALQDTTQKIGDLKVSQAELSSRIQSLQSRQITNTPPGPGLAPTEEADLAKSRATLQLNAEKLQDLERRVSQLNTEASPAPASSEWHAWLKDIVSDGDGLSFPRFQVLLWTIILGVVFIFRVCTRITMPEFDTTLLTLMGVSNGVYLGFKIPEKSA
jgi:hypothetical protein